MHYTYIYVSNKLIVIILYNEVLLRLGLAEGCARPSLPIGDDPNNPNINLLHYRYRDETYYKDLTVLSLEEWLIGVTIPQIRMILFQVGELL